MSARHHCSHETRLAHSGGTSRNRVDWWHQCGCVKACLKRLTVVRGLHRMVLFAIGGRPRWSSSKRAWHADGRTTSCSGRPVGDHEGAPLHEREVEGHRQGEDLVADPVGRHRRKVDWRRVIVALQGAVPAGRPSVSDFSDTRLFDHERAIAGEARQLATVRRVAVRGVALGKRGGSGTAM